MAFRQIASSATGTLGRTCRGRGNSPARTFALMIDGSGPSKGGFPGQQAVECGPEAVHVGGRAELRRSGPLPARGS